MIYDIGSISLLREMHRREGQRNAGASAHGGQGSRNHRRCARPLAVPLSMKRPGHGQAFDGDYCPIDWKRHLYTYDLGGGVEVRLDNRTAIVTGAGLAGSIGWGIARVLAREGAKIAILDVNKQAAKKTAQELTEHGIESLAYGVDVSNYTDFKVAVDHVISTWGHVDILCNNAGVCNEKIPIMTWDTSEAEFDQIIAVNCKGVWNGCRCLSPHMIDRKYGKIINISSISSKAPYFGCAVYSASKSFINALTSALAKEVAGSNVNVNAVAPGLVKTPCVDRLVDSEAEVWDMTSEAAFAHDVSPIPLGRPQSPEDVGNLVAFLVSEEAKEITGQCFSVDGGLAQI